MRWALRLSIVILLCLGFAGLAQAQQQQCPQITAPRIISTSTYKLTTNDRCNMVILTATGAITVQLPAPGLIFPATFKTTILPINGGAITFANLADDAGHFHQINQQTGLALLSGEGAILSIEQDMNWYALITGLVAGTSNVVADVTSAATLGSELTSGNFNGAGWTCPTGWTCGVNSAVWAVGTNVGAISESISVTSGKTYLVSWTQQNSVGGNQGTMTPAIGAAAGQPVSFLVNTDYYAGNVQEALVITATVTGSVAFTLTPAKITGGSGNMTITNLSVKQITPVTPSFAFLASDNSQQGPGIWSGGVSSGNPLNNSYIGLKSGLYTVAGYANTTLGYQAGQFLAAYSPSSVGGFGNTAIGNKALAASVDGANNTALGNSALTATTHSHDNTAIGYLAMALDITGSENTALGTNALTGCTYCWSNVALGDSTLGALTTGNFNVAAGEDAAVHLTTGLDNVVIGHKAGASTSGLSYFDNVIIGGPDINGNFAANGLTTGQKNTLIGNAIAPTLATGQNNVIIGTSLNTDVAAAGTSNTIGIGAGGAAIISATGTGTPGTSQSFIAGYLNINTNGVADGFNTQQLNVGAGSTGYVLAGFDQTNERGRLGAFDSTWRNLLLNEGGGDVLINTTTDCGASLCIGNTGATSGTILTQNGQASTPAFSFINDNTTGMYRGAASTLGFAVGGTRAGDYGIGTSGAWTFNKVNLIPAVNGTAGGPAYSFSSEGTTGMYWNGVNTLGFAVGGGVKLDYGITNSAMWTLAAALIAGGNLTTRAHVIAGGSAPALTSCGTNPAIVGDDTAGEVTMGTGSPTGCVITFNVAYVAAPICVVTWQATALASQSYAISNTAITLTQTGTSSDKVDYNCKARSGG